MGNILYKKETLQNICNKNVFDIENKYIKFNYEFGYMYSESSYYIYDKKLKFITPAISKCCNSSIKYQILKDLLGENTTKELYNGDMMNIHKLIIYLADHCVSLNINDKQFDDYIKFAVYRDPMDRLLSLYNHQPMNFSDNNIEKYLIENQELCNQHIRKQSSFYNLNDIQYLITSKNLSKFFINKFNVNLDKINESNKSLNNIVSSSKENIIKKYYEDDYILFENAKQYNKLYE